MMYGGPPYILPISLPTTLNFNLILFILHIQKSMSKYCTEVDSEFQLNMNGYKGQALTYTLYTKNKIT